MLAGSKHPLVLVGDSGWNEAACADMRRFAEANAIPVACAFRSQDLFDNSHELYAGDVGIAINPKLAARVRDADVLLVAGERLGEMTTGGYPLLRVPQPGPTLIHVHPGSEELGRVFQPALAIQASMPALAAALAQMAPIANPAWLANARQAHREYLAWREPRAGPGEV